MVVLLLTSPDGIAALVVFLIGEIGYRILVHVGIANPGLEMLFASFGAGTFSVLLAWRLLAKWAKRKKDLKQ